MNIHAIIDFSFLYYKYKFLRLNGKIKRLLVERGNEQKDVSEIYYSMKEVEKIRKDLEKYGHDVTVSVCFDSKSKRKQQDTEEAKEYKANRHSVLTEEDFQNILDIKNSFDKIGYSTYKIEGIEADDLVHSLVEYKDKFDFTFIYTTDADLIANVQNKVVVERYKTTKGYERVYVNNYMEYLSKEYKCEMPLNGITLFKCTVGDSSDGIKGIPKFGPKAFEKYVVYIEENIKADWNNMNNAEEVERVLRESKEYLTEENMNKALACLDLVRPIDLSQFDLEQPRLGHTKEKRNFEYSRLGFKSLVE